MTYTIKTRSYNEKRYGKPWLGIITGRMLTKDYNFVTWDGSWGQAGVFEFSAEPGQLLAHGQKDIRKNRGGVDGYYLCMPDGIVCVSRLPFEALALRSLTFAERVAKVEALNDTERRYYHANAHVCATA